MGLSRDTKDNSVRLSALMRKLLESVRRWQRRLHWLNVVQTPFREKWKKLEPSLTLLIVERDRLRLSSVKPVLLSMKWQQSIQELQGTRDVLRGLFTPCRLRLMTSFNRPRILRRRQRRPW